MSTDDPEVRAVIETAAAAGRVSAGTVLSLASTLEAAVEAGPRDRGDGDTCQVELATGVRLDFRRMKGGGEVGCGLLTAASEHATTGWAFYQAASDRWGLAEVSARHEWYRWHIPGTFPAVRLNVPGPPARWPWNDNQGTVTLSVDQAVLDGTCRGGGRAAGDILSPDDPAPRPLYPGRPGFDRR